MSDYTVEVLRREAQGLGLGLISFKNGRGGVGYKVSLGDSIVFVSDSLFQVMGFFAGWRARAAREASR